MLAVIASLLSAISPAPGAHFAMAADCAIAPYPGDPITQQLFPQDVAVLPDGSVLFVERRGQGCDRDKIVIVRSGRRRELSRPLATARSVDGHNYWISRIRVASDGTIFATLSDQFSGAYSGIRRQLFAYRNGTWVPVQVWCDAGDPSCASRNEDIGAAATADRYVVNHDYDDTAVGNWFVENPAKGSTTAILVSRGNTQTLGAGTVTAAAANWLYGYDDGFEHRLPLRAFRLAGANRAMLGAGIPFAVDRNGAGVGDDRASWREEGYPVVWSAARKERLTETHGTAFTIRNGVILGSSGGRAFAAWRRGTSWRVSYLDRAAGVRYRVISAFAFGTGGRVLALGRDASGDTTLLTIDLRKP